MIKHDRVLLAGVILLASVDISVASAVQPAPHVLRIEAEEPLPVMLPGPSPDFSGHDPRWVKAKDSDCWTWLSGPYYTNGAFLAFTWTGRCEDRLVAGSGVLTLLGQTLDDTYFTMETVTGSFSAGALNGHGAIVLADGHRTEGAFRGGRLNGEGAEIVPGGTQSAGFYINDQLNGAGETASPWGERYRGEFRNGQRDGHGVLRFEDGAVYEGPFHADMLGGAGRYCATNGQCLTGEVKPPHSDPQHPVVIPPYPPTAEDLNQTGTVQLRFLVHRDGHLSQVRVIGSTGHESLDAAAVAATAFWHVLPATVDGVPVEMEMTYGVAFNIR